MAAAHQAALQRKKAEDAIVRARQSVFPSIYIVLEANMVSGQTPIVLLRQLYRNLQFHLLQD